MTVLEGIGRTYSSDEDFNKLQLQLMRSSKYLYSPIQLYRQTIRRSFSKDTFDEGGASMEAGGRIYLVLTELLLPLMVSLQMNLTMGILTQPYYMPKKD